MGVFVGLGVFVGKGVLVGSGVSVETGVDVSGTAVSVDREVGSDDVSSAVGVFVTSIAESVSVNELIAMLSGVGVVESINAVPKPPHMRGNKAANPTIAAIILFCFKKLIELETENFVLVVGASTS